MSSYVMTVRLIIISTILFICLNFSVDRIFLKISLRLINPGISKINSRSSVNITNNIFEIIIINLMVSMKRDLF